MKRCFIETVAKTGLFGATELVLYRIPDNTDNRDPVRAAAATPGPTPLCVWPLQPVYGLERLLRFRKCTYGGSGY